jgi:hypothetical protein
VQAVQNVLSGSGTVAVTDPCRGPRVRRPARQRCGCVERLFRYRCGQTERGRLLVHTIDPSHPLRSPPRRIPPRLHPGRVPTCMKGIPAPLPMCRRPGPAAATTAGHREKSRSSCLIRWIRTAPRARSTPSRPRGSELPIPARGHSGISTVADHGQSLWRTPSPPEDGLTARPGQPTDGRHYPPDRCDDRVRAGLVVSVSLQRHAVERRRTGPLANHRSA